MSSSIASFSRDDKAADVAAALRRDGAAIVRELVAPEVMDAFTWKFAAELEQQEPGGGAEHSKDVYGRLLRSRDPVLGPNCHHYRVNVGGAMQVQRH